MRDAGPISDVLTIHAPLSRKEYPVNSCSTVRNQLGLSCALTCCFEPHAAHTLVGRLPRHEQYEEGIIYLCKAIGCCSHGCTVNNGVGSLLQSSVSVEVRARSCYPCIGMRLPFVCI